MKKVEDENYLDYDNVLIKPCNTQVYSRNNVNLITKYTFDNIEVNSIPIIAANMDTVGTFETYDVLKNHNIITAFHKFYTLNDYNERITNHDLNPDLYMVSSGSSDTEIAKSLEICNNINAKYLCIDIANGYQEYLIETCINVKKQNPRLILVVGNVATPEQVEKLIVHGKADIIKIGIGPGSACLTRAKTGVGVPQLSAVLKCAEAAKKNGGKIIADGGITNPGDLSKAFVAGADYVMMGGVFAGHDETPGDIIEENGQKFKLFYGMSSSQAMNKHYGKVNNYRTSEGREIKIKYKGSLENTIKDYLGGLRSCCTYINCNNIEEMYKKGIFLKVSKQLNTSLI